MVIVIIIVNAIITINMFVLGGNLECKANVQGLCKLTPYTRDCIIICIIIIIVIIIISNIIITTTTIIILSIHIVVVSMILAYKLSEPEATTLIDPRPPSLANGSAGRR